MGKHPFISEVDLDIIRRCYDDECFALPSREPHNIHTVTTTLAHPVPPGTHPDLTPRSHTQIPCSDPTLRYHIKISQRLVKEFYCGVSCYTPLTLSSCRTTQSHKSAKFRQGTGLKTLLLLIGGLRHPPS
jgi:hypothetical protein